MSPAAMAPGRRTSSAVVDVALGWRPLVGLMVLALGLRLLAYTGFFGSDEVTYTSNAFRLLDGDWTVDGYVGANRYGVNLPVAGLAWLFGRNEAAAALYSLLCSVAEVGLVTWFGSRMLGRRAGLLAGLVLATLPIHVHIAGRLIADAPLALAITASFIFFWDGEINRRRLSYLLAGLAAGWSFWVKPVTFFYLVVFLTYPLVFRTINRRWIWMVLGFAVVVLLNCIFFWVFADSFWFVVETFVKARSSGRLEADVAAGARDIEPAYYMAYLFVKIYHTWLLGYLALVGIARWWLRSRRRAPGEPVAMQYLIWWGLGLLAIFSLLVVSLSPLTLVPKQTNYMTVFLAPLALIAGYAVAELTGRRLAVLLAVIAGPSVVLALLLQADISVFTANSKAVVRFALDHPGAVVYANTNGYRAAQFHARVRAADARPEVRPMNQWNNPDKVDATAAVRYAVLDTQTANWGKREPYRRLADRPACWIPEGQLRPQLDGLGVLLVQLSASVVRDLPVLGSTGLTSRLDKLSAPAPAYVFRIPEAGC